MPDEFVKHKILDAIGDLFLPGMPIIGHFVAHKSGQAEQSLVKRTYDSGKFLGYYHITGSKTVYQIHIVQDSLFYDPGCRADLGSFNHQISFSNIN